SVGGRVGRDDEHAARVGDIAGVEMGEEPWAQRGQEERLERGLVDGDDTVDVPRGRVADLGHDPARAAVAARIRSTIRGFTTRWSKRSSARARLAGPSR